MEDTSITATFIWTFDEVKARQAALAGRRVSLTKGPITEVEVVAALFIVVAIVLIRNILKEPDITFSATQNLPLIALYILPILFVLAAIVMLVQKNNLKRGFLLSPDHNKPIVVTFTPDEIIMKVENVYENRWKWTALTGVRRMSEGFCFFVASKISGNGQIEVKNGNFAGWHHLFLNHYEIGFWIPMHAFQSARDADVVSEMARHLTPKYTVAAF